MSNEFNLIVEEINPGWTKKRITELLKEAENREILYMKSCQADMEKAVVQLRNAALSFIAKLPTEILNKPYFQGIQQYENGDGKNIVDQLVCEAKKRGRMEWEDTVKTLTGKRPRRLAGDERRQPVASTPIVIPEDKVLPTMSTVIDQTTEVASTPINEGRRITRTMLSRITHNSTTMNPPIMTVSKSVKSNPVRRISREMRERLLAKFDRNDTQLSASEHEQLQNLINSLQEFKNRCDPQSRRK